MFAITNTHVQSQASGASL